MLQNINTLWGHLIVDELVRSGVDTFCLSPGSRSTPLTVAVARHPRARAVVCFDERGAAFFALGYARATGKPAPLICTSGTAAANYLPAVIEADAEQLPLLVLSADRPPELRESGANQTIQQPNMLQPYVRWAFDMPAPTEAIAPEVVLTTVDQALFRATFSPAGPVHLNCMFREPLAPSLQPVSAEYTASLARWRDSAEPYTRYYSAMPTPDPAAIADIAERMAAIERGVLVVGRLADGAEIAAVQALAQALGWPTLVDVQSGLRLGVQPSAVVAYADQVLLGDMPAPEMVLHIGGQLVSKRYGQFIGRIRPRHHVIVKPHPLRHDPTHSATERITAAPGAFSTALRAQLAGRALAIDAAWQAQWHDAGNRVGDVIDRFSAENDVLSEISAARLVSRHLPADHGLWLGSSMPVRDMDMFAHVERAAPPALWQATPRVGSNRGASGIDGTIASATGFAHGLGQPVTLMIGDLTLLHDLNSLSLLRTGAAKLIIVLLNNQGGGIFHLLPIAEFTDVFEPFFGTPHNYSFGDAASLFGLNYHAPQSNAAFVAAYRAALVADGSTLIEVHTDRTENVALHRRLQAAVRAS